VKALVKTDGSKKLALREVEEPVLGADEVLIQVRAVGICGTDLHILRDEYPHAEPLIPGHEFAGDVVDAGADVRDWKAGDRVVAELHTGACRKCEICLSGNPQICPHKRAYGTWRDGAFAERIALPAWLLHRIPDEIAYEQATLFEPTACSVHGLLERGGFEPGHSVFVAGHGPIGLMCAQVARAGGARSVVVSGTSRRGTVRLDAARGLGFEVIDASETDPVHHLTEATGGRGVDIAVETAGTQQALTHAIEAARRGGRVAILGLSSDAAASFPWNVALVNDLDMAFSFSSNYSSWRRTIDLSLTDRLDLEAMITHVLPMSEWERGLAAIEAGEAVKVVLQP